MSTTRCNQAELQKMITVENLNLILMKARTNVPVLRTVCLHGGQSGVGTVCSREGSGSADPELSVGESCGGPGVSPCSVPLPCPPPLSKHSLTLSSDDSPKVQRCMLTNMKALQAFPGRLQRGGGLHRTQRPHVCPEDMSLLSAGFSADFTLR